MSKKISLHDVLIRTKLRAGDMGYITYLHGRLYSQEYQYGISFEHYVAKGLSEFYQHYDSGKDKLWIAEYKEKIVGFLLLLHRGKAAQLRYFIIDPEYRGIGLGKKLMGLYMESLKEGGYESSYLWTTQELDAAAALYKRYGFSLTEEKESDDFGKKVVEQRYEWNASGNKK